jgi:Ca2+-binding RTX toxin-like protein
MKQKHPGSPIATPVFDDTGPSSSSTPYLVPTHDGVQFVSLLTTGDQVGLQADGVTPWRMAGIPDGLGAFDNGDGTMTVLMNHELGATSGAVREHGSTGAFVSKLIIDKDTLQVVEAGDLIQTVQVWDPATDSYRAATPAELAFNRLCSGDLPAQSALYYEDATGTYGTQEKIYFNGEETGPPFDMRSGRAFAHQVTDTDGDATLEAGTTIELARFGNMSFENILLNPHSQMKTVAIETDDSTPGEVYVYVGTKQTTGNEFEKAGLTNGKLYGILASWGDDGSDSATRTTGTFALVAQGNDGDVSEYDPGVTANPALSLQNEAAALTQFGRPEDGAWDPSNPNRFYFVTTGTADAPSRLWALDFIDVEHPELGGTITMLLDGSEGHVFLDNMTVTESGLVIIQEDPGSSSRLAKIWMYDPNTDAFTELAQHDPARFSAGSSTPAPGGFFNTNEESSGVVDVTGLLGDDDRLAFLLDVQAHYTIDTDPVTPGVQGELVEGGQLLTMYVDLPNPGDSRFNGGNGADTYDGGFGDDRIAGGRGADTLYGNYGDDRIDGGDGDDTIDGGVGADDVEGGKGNDRIAGGTGDDELEGEDGNDTIAGGVGNDELDGGRGRDTLEGGFGDDELRGGADSDTLEGNQGSDRLSGDDGNDRLLGGSGADDLRGGDGNDFLDGGEGIDLLNGGRGSDIFFFADPAEGEDTIVGFRPGDDLIQLDIDVDPSLVSFLGFEDGSGSPGTGPELIYSDASGDLFWDATGGSSDDQVLVATLTNSPQLHIGDILLI